MNMFSSWTQILSEACVLVHANPLAFQKNHTAKQRLFAQAPIPTVPPCANRLFYYYLLFATPWFVSSGLLFLLWAGVPCGLATRRPHQSFPQEIDIIRIFMEKPTGGTSMCALAFIFASFQFAKNHVCVLEGFSDMRCWDWVRFSCWAVRAH